MNQQGGGGQGAGGRPLPQALLPLEFVASYPDPLQPLQPALPEIALIGRSNVGKSSLLNALAGRRSGGRGLARVSAAPGKTELLNVYRFPAGYLLDLPGYGYARRSQRARAGFRRLLEAVAARRPSLSGVIWLLDLRHPPSEDDAAIQRLLARTGRPVLAVLTKADKLKPAQRTRAARERARELGLEPAELLVTSSVTKLGIAELLESILDTVRGER